MTNQEIGHCKDCDRWKQGKRENNEDWYSDEGFCNNWRTITGEDFYCADFEVKENKKMKNQEAIADLMLAQADVFYRPKDDSIDMAIIALKQERSRSAEITQYRYDCEKLMEENERLKKALEQEPCEDCISRQAVDELSKELVHTTRDKADFLCNFWEGLKKLPSVTPQTNIGHWVVYSELTGEWEGTKKYACDKCGEKVGVFKSNYCPNCGAKMVEPQESEKINCKSTKCENCINHNYCDFETQKSEE